MNKIKIVIVDDKEEFLDYFKTVLSHEPEIDVIGVARSGEDALRVVEECEPDIVLMDIQMETETAGIDAIEQIKMNNEKVKIIVFTIHEEEDILFKAFGAGALDFIVKTSSVVDIINSIKNSYNNKLSIRPEYAGKILTEFSRMQNERRSLIFTLNIMSKVTRSEFEILKAFYYGSSSKEIAEQRCVEELTIRVQVNKILKKFQMRRMKDVIELLKGLSIFDIYKSL